MTISSTATHLLGLDVCSRVRPDLQRRRQTLPLRSPPLPDMEPAWSSRLLLSINYINHLTAIRTEILRDVGGIRTGFDGAQDHDLMLRVSQAPDLRATHIPAVLYHWRIWSESFSQSADPAFARSGAGWQPLPMRSRVASGKLTTLSTGSPFNYRPRFRERVPRPTVKVVIPTRDRARLLQVRLGRLEPVPTALMCTSSSLTTGGEGFSSRVPRGTQDPTDVTVIRIDDGFNYSALCNAGSRDPDQMRTTSS